MGTKVDANWHWIRTGQEMFLGMLDSIENAQRSVRLEMYTVAPDALGEKFREALCRACQRGVEVRLIYDALGSLELPGAFWDALRKAGGQVRQFNPLALERLGIRDHRKLLVTDRATAFVGGFNISSDYDGDGVSHGWCDLGLRLRGPLVEQLALTFEEMYERADFLHKRFARLRKMSVRRKVESAHEQLLLSGPGRERSPIKTALRRDLLQARQVDIMVAYFLPTWRLRHDLMAVVRRGGRVRLLLAGKSDVQVSQLAARSLYRRLLRAGIQIFEYQPQVLHAKLAVIDNVVYVGSANLDQRSLNINYELMVRFDSGEMAAEAKDIFETRLRHGRMISQEQWKASRTWWSRLKQHWAYFLLVRIDPYIARSQWRALPD